MIPDEIAGIFYAKKRGRLARVIFGPEITAY
jgi:hypothetical protein